MNQRNVEALAAAIGGALFEVSQAAFAPDELLDVARKVIASRGVLVPKALTDRDFGPNGLEGFWWPDGAAMPSGDVRQRLERIARGKER